MFAMVPLKGPHGTLIDSKTIINAVGRLRGIRHFRQLSPSKLQVVHVGNMQNV